MEDKYIQVMGYREGFDKRTNKPYIYQKHFDHILVRDVEALFKNLDAIVELIPSHERFNVHYTNANCFAPNKEKSIPLRLFHHQEMIPIDLDGINMEYKQKYIDIVLGFLGVSYERTGIFCSGNGLHFVVALDSPISSVDDLERLQGYYKLICGEINERIFNEGLSGHADPVRLAEAATLRLPNTTNRKKDKLDVEAYVIQGNVEKQSFYMDKLVTLPDAEEKAEGRTYFTDTEAVLTGCDFLKYCHSNQGALSEPQWYAMVGVLSFIPTIGETLVHEYSKGHKSYDSDATDAKIQQARGLGKPRLCSSVETVFPACNGCQYYGKCKTPLQIKGDDFIATEKDGFHNIKYDKDGNVKALKPNYVDLVKFFQRQTPYVVQAGTSQLYRYNGTHWEDVSETEIGAFATKNFNPAANNNMRNEFKGLLYSTNVVDEAFFGRTTDGYINFANGVLKLQGRVLTPHSVDFGFRYVLPYDYNPNAVCPEFDAMMKRLTCNDEETISTLMEYVGYAISGIDPSWGQKALILTGSGANGKSTFIDVIRSLVGQQTYSTVQIKHFSNETRIYPMLGKLFNICEEEQYDSLRDSTAFKAICTGTETLVKKLYQEPFTARITCKLIIGCNEIPPTNDHTHATYRRLLIVPFRARFTGGDVDRGVLGRVKNEMSGIYNRVLDALDRLVANEGEFTKSKAIQDALNDYISNNDVIAQFGLDCLEIEDGVFLSHESLMNAFKNWRITTNNRADYNINTLSKRLRHQYQLGETDVARINGKAARGLKGIKLIEAERF